MISNFHQTHFKNLKSYLTLMVILISAFIYFSYLITGDSWNFITQCYIRAYSPTYYYPGSGLIWTLFSGLFTRYKLMYHFLCAVLPLSYIYPLIKIYKDNCDQYKMKQGLLGYYISNAIFINCLHFQYVTVQELMFVYILHYHGFEYSLRNRITFFVNWTSLFILGLASHLGQYWMESLVGNANFLFFQTTVVYIFQAILMTQTINQLYKSKFLDI